MTSLRSNAKKILKKQRLLPRYQKDSHHRADKTFCVLFIKFPFLLNIEIKRDFFCQNVSDDQIQKGVPITIISKKL